LEYFLSNEAQCDRLREWVGYIHQQPRNESIEFVAFIRIIFN
jgi:hypothetical protein